jgi:serine/threonine protein kinase
MDELEACYFLRQFISAMDYLHRHKVAHRCVESVIIRE